MSTTSLRAMNTWPKTVWLGLMVVVVGFHLIFLFGVASKPSSRLDPSYNHNSVSDGYDELAKNLVAGHGYRFYPETAPTLMREPGYPILLAALTLAFGPSITVIKLTNVVMVVATAWLVTRLGRRVSTNPLMVYGAPLLFLLHPGVIIAESRGSVESLFTLLVVFFLFTFYEALDSGRWWNYVLSGLALGLAVSVRSVVMLFPLFWAIYLVAFDRRRMPAVTICRNTALIFVAMFTVLSPWIIRNYALTKRFVPTASVLGVSAHAGQYIDTHLFNGKPLWLLDREAARERRQMAIELGYPFEDGYYQSFYRSEDEMKFSNFLMGRVINEYRRYPLMFVKCLVLNAFNFWCAGKTWASTGANLIVQLPYLILSFVGIRIALRNYQGRLIAPLLLFIVYTVAVYMPILAQARYSVPLIPFISILAAVAVIHFQREMGESSKQRSVTVPVSSFSD